MDDTIADISFHSCFNLSPTDMSHALCFTNSMKTCQFITVTHAFFTDTEHGRLLVDQQNLPYTSRNHFYIKTTIKLYIKQDFKMQI